MVSTKCSATEDVTSARAVAGAAVDEAISRVVAAAVTGATAVAEAVATATAEELPEVVVEMRSSKAPASDLVGSSHSIRLGTLLEATVHHVFAALPDERPDRRD
jgi:hypothetical protein